GDVVLNAITGSVGLLPTLAVLSSGARLALANKEALAVGGDLVTRAAAPGQILTVDYEHTAIPQALAGGRPEPRDRLLVTRAAAPGQILPVDSEHTAIAQALAGVRPEQVDRLVVTASGGPFRGRTRDQLADIDPEQALAHPTWAMGPVITTNSATLVNKAL